MTCEYFSKCGSCTLHDYTYEEQLNYKITIEKERFKEFNIHSFDIIKSDTTHFRSRAEFRIWKTFDEHDNIKLSYAMNDFKRNILEIKSCSMVHPKIADLMPKLLEALQHNDIFKIKLFSIEFLCTPTDKILVTLIYHKKLDEMWTNKAKQLENELSIKLIGRSRGQKLILSEEYCLNEFTINEKNFKIKQYEGAFTQPNQKVNTQMIAWVLKNISSGGDLCELYCGGGNFTIPLSTKFNKVVATEISKTSIRSAKESCELNSINNIEFLRMSSEEFVQALNNEREFNRLKDVNLNAFSFTEQFMTHSSSITSCCTPSTLFVDPPRAGLDSTTRSLAKKFDQIIYISCNAQTLQRDLEELSRTHSIKHFALFDQFAYTKHIECGVILQKKK
jgi:tRNA (uracil-5-)-methyltransferase